MNVMDHACLICYEKTQDLMFHSIKLQLDCIYTKKKSLIHSIHERQKAELLEVKAGVNQALSFALTVIRLFFLFLVITASKDQNIIFLHA